MRASHRILGSLRSMIPDHYARPIEDMGRVVAQRVAEQGHDRYARAVAKAALSHANSRCVYVAQGA